MFPKPHCYDLILHRKIGMNMQTKHKKKARKHDSKLKCRRWKGELEEIRKEQSSIREGQSQVGEKLEAMEIECEALHEESKLMIKRSALTQIRLAVMLNILTARKGGDYAIRLRSSLNCYGWLNLLLHILQTLYIYIFYEQG
ncbi:uncharacterized protein LOC108463574 isoform X2 [Gossypium arboreum]|uniref:uncharacterized protein LOC108463574 isoform X2 n=1 Tax=Gossypium arboreum TaxID=29729 RepID=UPI0008196884|nr:uncharacterized protein LOC108463574 isoform X2 [Gossypium arboreum]